MRIIATRQIREWQRDYPNAIASLEQWVRITTAATWSSIVEVRRDFPTADGVTVESGNVVTVFNIAGNNYRLLTAIHDNRGIVYVMRFLTHAEYNRNQWFRQL
jgi:mRNA interferase HigB